jgi:segregation and condensation protein B
MELQSLIEALLFSRAEPWTSSELAKAISVSTQEIDPALSALESALSSRGICLVRADDTVTLGTQKEAHSILEKIYKEELEKGLSKASIETLSIIMYGGEVTRGKIDYIRGVNSSFILRSLLIRGLIERKPYPHDRKRFMYVPTVALLAQLGVDKVESLVDYERIHGELTKTSPKSDSEETSLESNENDTI